MGDAVTELLHDIQAVEETLLVEGPVEFLPQRRFLEYVPVFAEGDPALVLQNVPRTGGEVRPVVAVESPAIALWAAARRNCRPAAGQEAYRETRDRTTYRCTGHRAANPCNCQEILAGPLEDAVWAEVTKVLGDQEKLKRLAEEWLGDVPKRTETYRGRIADLDAQIEENRRMRNKKLVALAAVVAADGGGDAATEADLQVTIGEVTEEIKKKEQHLRVMRDDTMEWLLEAQQQEDRAKEVLELALKMRPQLDSLPLDKKRELLDLLDVRVEVTSDVPGNLRNKGCPFEAWFSDNERLVPPPLTDEQWSRIEDQFPRPKKRSRVVPPRVAFEASLHKVRHGLPWKDLPESVTQVQNPQAIYQRALAYLKIGAGERAVYALGDYAGTPVPPLYQLPDLHITATFDPRLCTPPEPVGTEADAGGARHQTTRGAAAARFSSCSPPTPGSSTATTDRSCGPCSALWRGLRTNDLQVVSTDHCPFCFQGHKELGRGDFSKIPNGMPGVENRMDLLHQGVVEGRISRRRWIEIACATPARMFGLYPKKGTIAPGADADLVLYDPTAEQTVSAETHHMNVDYSPYEGKRLTSRVETVLSRGELVIDRREFTGHAGHGQYIPRGTCQYLI